MLCYAAVVMRAVMSSSAGGVFPRVRLGAVLAWVGLIGACAGGGASGGSSVAFSTASRDRAFDAARDVLRGAGYRLDRVDSGHGVLTTQARPSGGSPFTSTPATDVLHEQSRTVRVEFSESGATVECFVSRTQTPNVELSTRAVGLSASSYDPTNAERGLGFRYSAPVSRDEVEASRLARLIRRSLEGAK